MARWARGWTGHGVLLLIAVAGGGIVSASVPLPILCGGSPGLFAEEPVISPTGVVSGNFQVQRSRIVRVNEGLLRPGRGTLQDLGSRIPVNLFGAQDFTLVVDTVDVFGPSSFTCVGHFENVPGSSVVLASVAEALVGTFSCRDWERPIQLSHLGKGIHELRDVARHSPHWCANPVALGSPEDRTPPRSRADTQPPPESTSNAPPIIDLLFLYTPAALAGAGGEPGISALIRFAAAETALCFSNSGIDVRVNVVGQQLADYCESGNLGADWLWLANNQASLRASFQPDLLILIVESERFGYCGLSLGIDAVLVRSAMTAGFYLATHELGHLIGAGHDHFTCAALAPQAGCGAYISFSHGHRLEADGVTYRTVMSYLPGAGIPYFSNPQRTFRGVPLGIPVTATNAADNARTINLRAPVKAALMEPRGRIEFAAATQATPEAAAQAHIQVVRTGDLSLSAEVYCVTVPGTATSGADFAAFATRLGFAPGQSRAWIPIDLLDDSFGEGDETFLVTLQTPAPGLALGAVHSCRVTIVDDDAWVGFADLNPHAWESAGAAIVRLHRGGDFTAHLPITIVCESLTATSGEDYVESTSTLTFEPDQRELEMLIPLLPDATPESDELFVVRVSASNLVGVISPGQVIVRILDDDRPGSLDAAFHGAAFPERLVASQCLRVRSDGRILLAGVWEKPDGTRQVCLRSFLTDGSADPCFAPAVFLSTRSPEKAVPPAQLYFVEDSAGRLLVSGSFASVAGLPRTNLVRLNLDGTVDPTFQASSDCTAVALLQTDSRILLAGDFHWINGTWMPYLARLNPDGSLDSTFRPTPSLHHAGLKGLALQSDGRILVRSSVCEFSGQTRAYLARLWPDGSFDPSFRAQLNGIVQDLRVLPDDRLLIGGGFTSPARSIARLQPDGQRDPGFDPGDIFNGPIYALAPLPDGRILVSGRFSLAGPSKQTGLMRLQPDGQPDLSFDGGVGPDDLPTLALEPSGSLLISGAFTHVNGEPVAPVARIRSDGTRPVFGPLLLRPDGTLALRLLGCADRTYELECSGDLIHWAKVRTVTLCQPSYDCAFPRSQHPAQFFRVRQLPP